MTAVDSDYLASRTTLNGKELRMFLGRPTTMSALSTSTKKDRKRKKRERQNRKRGRK